MIKVGDTISFASSFGFGPIERGTIKGLEVTKHPREKYGKPVKEASKELVRANKVLITVDKGEGNFSSRWLYSEQLREHCPA
jgi:hypothetical protein